jgi:hypothetical protein
MKRAILILTVVLLYGCGTSARMWTSIDTWFREAPVISEPPWKKVPQDQLYSVLPDKREEAIALLASQSAVVVPLQDAERFSGTPLRLSKYYLVRGLCLACGNTGGFLVYRNGPRISVVHHSLASRALPMTRWPVIVSLDTFPFEVYVEVTADS